MKVSNCCGALPHGETHDNSEDLEMEIGLCSKCLEHAVFDEEE